MGKYQSSSGKNMAPRPDKAGAYMRGIGCGLMLVVPVFSFALGQFLAERKIGAGILPNSWYGNLQFPDFLARSGLAPITNFLSQINYLPATLIFTVLGILLIGGLLSIIFGYMYNIMAPSRYGPMDVPPPRVKTKKYTR